MNMFFCANNLHVPTLKVPPPLIIPPSSPTMEICASGTTTINTTDDIDSPSWLLTPETLGDQLNIGTQDIVVLGIPEASM